MPKSGRSGKVLRLLQAITQTKMLNIITISNLEL